MFEKVRVNVGHALPALIMCLMAATRAFAQSPPATCSAAYFTALGELRASRGEDLTNAIANMRAADPALPGRWIYSRGLLGKTFRDTHPIEIERPCVEKVKVAGRLRCARYAGADASTEPPLPTELEITPAPTSDELRLLKAVADLVDGRGAIPDVGNNGRQTWLASRAASDLRLYVSQPEHPALCSGAKEVTEFYAASMKPLQKRVDDVAELAKRARLLAATRIAAVASAAMAPAAASSVAAPPAVVPPADAGKVPMPVAATPPAAPTPPPVPAAELARLPLTAMIAEAIRLVVPADMVEAVLKESTGLAALQRAKPALILAQVEAQKSDDKAARERVLAAGRAVRMIEVVAYTEIYAERYRKFTATVLTLPREIQAAHTRTCTCGN